MRGLPIRLRRLVYGLRTEGGGRGRDAAAVGIGVFIGCLPFYGLHLLLCVGVSTVLGLNRLKTYLASNISNPLVAPWLLLAEAETGAWLRRGELHALTFAAVKSAGLGMLGADLLAGSAMVGTVLGVMAASCTFAMTGNDAADPFLGLVRRASDRYAEVSLTAWEFARGKLRFDPVYHALVCDGLLTVPSTRAPRTLVDIGCGQGLALSLLAEVRAGTDAAHHRELAMPVFERLIGIESRPRIAAMASAALGSAAHIVTGDARATALGSADAVLFVDVLHMMPYAEQEALLSAALRSLVPDGTLVIRDVDAGAGWAFRTVAFGNRLKALAFGHWRQRFHFRTAADWQVCLARLGLIVTVRSARGRTPFGNVLFTARRAAAATPSMDRTGTSSAVAR